MLNLLNLSQLDHIARCEGNALALAILTRLDDEIADSVEQALEAQRPNDADYSYDIFDAVYAVEWLLFEAEWYRTEETKHNKDSIMYMFTGLHEDSNPYNNQVSLSRYKGTEKWTLTAQGGQYGESQEVGTIIASGFKSAQDQAARMLILWIKKGWVELNIG